MHSNCSAALESAVINLGRRFSGTDPAKLWNSSETIVDSSHMARQDCENNCRLKHDSKFACFLDTVLICDDER